MEVLMEYRSRLRPKTLEQYSKSLMGLAEVVDIVDIAFMGR